jgi:hypothetical protein
VPRGFPRSEGNRAKQGPHPAIAFPKNIFVATVALETLELSIDFNLTFSILTAKGSLKQLRLT